jgi:hypothetical protein
MEIRRCQIGATRGTRHRFFFGDRSRPPLSIIPQLKQLTIRGWPLNFKLPKGHYATAPRNVEYGNGRGHDQDATCTFPPSKQTLTYRDFVVNFPIGCSGAIHTNGHSKIYHRSVDGSRRGVSFIRWEQCHGTLRWSSRGTLSVSRGGAPGIGMVGVLGAEHRTGTAVSRNYAATHALLCYARYAATPLAGAALRGHHLGWRSFVSPKVRESGSASSAPYVGAAPRRD